MPEPQPAPSLCPVTWLCLSREREGQNWGRGPGKEDRCSESKRCGMLGTHKVFWEHPPVVAQVREGICYFISSVYQERLGCSLGPLCRSPRNRQ